MLGRQVDEEPDVAVAEAVVDHALVFAAANDANGTEKAQRAADGVLRKGQGRAEVADAQLACFGQGGDDSSAVGVPKKPEHLRDPLCLGRGQQAPAGSFDPLGMHHLDCAPIQAGDVTVHPVS